MKRKKIEFENGMEILVKENVVEHKTGCSTPVLYIDIYSEGQFVVTQAVYGKRKEA